jgi:predicted ferric reductase
MKHAKRFFWGFLFALSVLWWFADATNWVALPNVFAWRNVLLQYSGTLSIGVMSVAMLLAVRPVLFEAQLGGLDKMYRLHKWLGITALATSVSHWLIAQGPKWLAGWGWIARGVRGPRPALPDDAIRQFFQSQHRLAESVGEWTFYAAAVLMLIALIKWFPYRLFLRTHQWLALAYLALVGHAVILLQWSYWSQPLGWFLAVLMVAGSVSSVLVLLGRVARSRKHSGQVVAVRYLPALQVTEVEVLVPKAWPGHVAGQFAFLTLHAGEGAHPFTISSAWCGDGRLVGSTRSLASGICANTSALLPSGNSCSRRRMAGRAEASPASRCQS